jgi:hypothetical protein
MPGYGREAAMKQAVQMLAIAGLFLVLQPYESASGGGGNVDPGGASIISKATARALCQGNWTRPPNQLCTWCGRGLLGVGKCQVIRCGRAGCNYIGLPRGTARAARIHLSDCINSNESCRLNCAAGSALPPNSGLIDVAYNQCMNRCGAIHFACVDAAMDLSPGR